MQGTSGQVAGRLAQRSHHVMQENNLISIQEVSVLLKVPKPTLRFWEKELDGILVPLRTDGGQRRYTVENITVIEEIKKLVFIQGA